MFKKPKPAPETTDDLKKWSSQIRKGSLEMCLLGVLAHEPRYGFEIVQHLNETSGLAVSEGTLYPLLNRLQNEALIEALFLRIFLETAAEACPSGSMITCPSTPLVR